MHGVDAETSYAALWWKLVILGFGIGIDYSLIPGIGLRALPDASAGQGSGVINTFLFIGIALGIAAGGVVMEHVLAGSIEPVLERLAVPSIGTLDAAITHGAQDRIDGLLAQLAPADAAQIRLAMREASARAFGAVMAMMALLALLGAALGFGLIRDRRMPAAR
jgi:hypothetical protein